MSFLRKSKKVLSKAASGVRLLCAFSLFALTVLQGVTLCLCAPDPDCCGEHCHDCGSAPEPQTEHVEHACDHLTVAELPPGETFSSGLEELLAGLFVLAVEPAVACVPAALFHAPERPPDVLYPQLNFISRSAQILC